ncbi:MAG: hypothetical protein ACI4UM_01855 [Succinivibrio sp.]
MSASISFGVFICVHLLSSVLFAIGASKYFPESLASKRVQAAVYVFVICFFIPVAGFAGTLISVVYALRNPLELILKTWQENVREELPSNPRNMMYTRFGTGALRDILINSPVVDRRVDAITSVSRLPRAQRISFYKMALRDPADDVRLLAYSQLDPLEQEINDNICDLEKNFLQTNSADTAFDIAQQFWELCYLGISDGALFSHYISKANEWCRRAISIEDRPSYELLQGRICLNLNQSDKAYEALMKAKEHNILSSQVIPYLAECAFISHDYKKVRELLNELPSDSGSRLTQIKEYWRETN